MPRKTGTQPQGKFIYLASVVSAHLCCWRRTGNKIDNHHSAEDSARREFADKVLRIDHFNARWGQRYDVRLYYRLNSNAAGLWTREMTG
jgi:hypothetical protein